MVEKYKDLTTSLVKYANLFPISTTYVKNDITLGPILNEFTCILCLNIVNRPLLINCCSRLFCFSCIYLLLEQNGKCPFCYFKDIQIELPNYLIMRIFNCLIMTCPLSGYFTKKNSKEILKCNSETSISDYHDHILNKCKISLLYKESKEGFEVIKKIPEETNLFMKYLKDDYLYCCKCHIIDLRRNHNCKEIKIYNVTMEAQNKLLKFLFLNKNDSKKTDPIITHLHSHPLYYTNFRVNSNQDNCSTWNCDFCFKNIEIPISVCSYNCEQCDFDLCLECFNTQLTKIPKKSIHPHPLKIRNEESWTCDVCAIDHGYRKSFWCEQCDYDICITCYYL